MDDAGAVRGLEALKRIFDDRRDLAERQVRLATKALVEPLPVQTLEGDPEAPIAVLSCAENPGDIRRLDRRGDRRLALEPGDEIGVLGGLFVEDLERDVLAAFALRGIHLTHATLADETPHFVQPAHDRAER